MVFTIDDIRKRIIPIVVKYGINSFSLFGYDIQKFCIYCCKKLLDDYQIKILLDNPEPYCLNCGRPVNTDQTERKFEYKFANIKFPHCKTENEYTNKFCTTCGKKLWKYKVSDYKYNRRIFEQHLLKETLPQEFHNISVYKRSKNMESWFDKDTFHYNAEKPNWQLEVTLERLNSEDLNTSENLYEICSRWRNVSPNYCINCLKMNSSVCSCMTPFLTDKKRIKFLQSEKQYYMKPHFDDKG